MKQRVAPLRFALLKRSTGYVSKERRRTEEKNFFGRNKKVDGSGAASMIRDPSAAETKSAASVLEN